MASIVMASIVMDYIAMALYSYGLYSHGLCSEGVGVPAERRQLVRPLVRLSVDVAAPRCEGRAGLQHPCHPAFVYLVQHAVDYSCVRSETYSPLVVEPLAERLAIGHRAGDGWTNAARDVAVGGARRSQRRQHRPNGRAELRRRVSRRRLASGGFSGA